VFGGGDVRVKVCDDGAFAFGDGDVFVSGTFDDGEGDGFLRHCVCVSIYEIRRILMLALTD
jgi:hypothetical protein